MLKCSFCGKSSEEVEKLVAGTGDDGKEVFICNECIELANKAVTKERKKREKKKIAESISDVPYPKDIKKYLDQYIIGQEDSKKVMASAIYNHQKRIKNNFGDEKITKSDICFVGPTGSGKTEMIRVVKEYLKDFDIPVSISDASSLTAPGYVGDDIESILTRLYVEAGGDVEKAQRGIIYLDEVDKIARKGSNPSITRDVSGESVQQSLLKMIEGNTVAVPKTFGRKSAMSEMVTIDTSNILFIIGGAFEGLEQIIRKRLITSPISISSINKTNKMLASDDIFKGIIPDDLVNYGMLPEFIGRTPIITRFTKLSKETIRNILTEPKNSLVDQYIRSFKLDGIDLKIADDAFDSIAEYVLKKNTGARGLRALMEEVLGEAMYELPGSGETEFVLTKEVIERTIDRQENAFA